MVAERRQLTSLRTPPPGWTPAAHQRGNSDLYNSRARGGAVPWQESQTEAAPGGAELPTLTPGISALPTSCPHCSSRLLCADPPLGEHRRGTVTCSMCGRQMCWLAAPISVRAPERPSPIPTIARAPLMVVSESSSRPVLTGRFHRVDGCGPACSILYGHDATTHELYGRERALADLGDRPRGVVRTGPLIVDFDRDLVTVGGVDPGLSPTEHKMLLCLAERLGQVCPHAVMLEVVWGPERLGGAHRGAHDRLHLLRVNKTRMCQRLGPAGRLIQVHAGRGYLLRDEPPTGVAL